jgi:hypothetical protein
MKHFKNISIISASSGQEAIMKFKRHNMEGNEENSIDLIIA